VTGSDITQLVTKRYQVPSDPAVLAAYLSQRRTFELQQKQEFQEFGLRDTRWTPPRRAAETRKGLGVRSLDWSSSGDYFIVCCREKVWVCKTAPQQSTHDFEVACEVSSDDDKYECAAANPKQDHIFALGHRSNRKLAIYDIRVDPRSGPSATGSPARTTQPIRTPAVAKAKELGRAEMRDDWPQRLAWRPDGTVLAIADSRDKLTIYDIRLASRPIPASDKKYGNNSIEALAYDSLGEYLFVASQSYLEVYRGQPLPGEQRVHLSKGGAILRQTDETSAVTTLAADPGGEWMACGYDDGLVELWDLQTMTCPKTIACSTGSIGTLSVNHDGSLLALGGPYDQMVFIWGVDTDVLVHSWAPGKEHTHITKCKWHPRQNILLYSLHEGSLDESYEAVYRVDMPLGERDKTVRELSAIKVVSMTDFTLPPVRAPG